MSSNDIPTEYNAKGLSLGDHVISNLLQDDAPKIITERAKSATISETSDNTLIGSNLVQTEEMDEEGLLLDLLENITYLGEAKAGGNFGCKEYLMIYTLQKGQSSGTG